MARVDDGFLQFEESDVVVFRRTVVALVNDACLHCDGFLARLRCRRIVFSKHELQLR